MPVLPNPESEWEQPPWGRGVTLAEIQERIGPLEDPPQLMPGGHANVNLRLCSSKVLRIYRREKKAVGKEAALLRRSWKALRVPHVFGRGMDYLVLENVRNRPLEDGAEQGAQVGRALAEIHSHGYPSAGLLDPDLDLAQRIPDFVATLRERVAVGAHDAFAELRKTVAATFDRLAGALREATRPAVLLHGDFKPANLFACGVNDLLVLDWEFAYAGPALMDVGPLLRWSPSEDFVGAFEKAYRDGGHSLPEGWRSLARVLDLANVVELLENAAPNSRRGKELRQLIERTVSEAA